MKKYILIGLVSIFASSCEDFLNTEPVNKIALEQYYTDEAGLTSALAGVYDVLGSENLYGNAFYTKLEACTDEGYYARSTQVTGIEVYNFDPTNAEVNALWSTLYIGVNRANDLIAHINVPQMDEEKRQVILGEALFLRGYYYFMLVSRFGDVPLKTTPTTSANEAQIAKTPTAEVYAQILEDMKAAETKVATATSYGYSSRISKTTVQGILARVCLQMAGYPLMDTAKYADALAWSKKVIDSGEHALNTSFDTAADLAPAFPSVVTNTSNNGYRQIFINEARDIYNVKECMWEIEFEGNRTGAYTEEGRLGNTNGIQFTNASLQGTVGYSYGFINGTGKLFKSYGTGDLRRDWVLTTYTLANATGTRTRINPATLTTAYNRNCGKWRREYEIVTPKHKNYTPINFPVLRYADVLLMYAEAENQVNGPTAAAVAAVNQVRRRAYGATNLATANVTADVPAASFASKAAFQLYIEDERMRELCFEGTRRSDLIRWNKFVTTMNAVAADIKTNAAAAQQYGALGGNNVTARNLLFPIPSSELLSNKALTQNEAWLN